MTVRSIVTATFLILMATASQAEPAHKVPLYEGKGAGNNGAVTTVQGFNGGSTGAIGFTIDEASVDNKTDYVEVFVGKGPNSTGVVTRDRDYLNQATESIGMVSKKPILGGKKLYVGTNGCANGVVSVNYGHLNCPSAEFGWTMP